VGSSDVAAQLYFEYIRNFEYFEYIKDFEYFEYIRDLHNLFPTQPPINLN
jgi:hypothetical protein